jgi:WD40 repeat protein
MRRVRLNTGLHKMQKWQALFAQLEVFNEGQDILTQEELVAFETKTGLILPTEYKKFCQVFGLGWVGESIRIFCPTSSPQYSIDNIKYTVNSSPPFVSVEEIEKNMKRSQIISLLENAFAFGDDGGAHVAFFDLKSYSESDLSCDIYWATCPDFDGNIILVGRNFFEFVRDFCLGTSSYEILPVCMWTHPVTLIHTFTSCPRAAKIDPQKQAEYFQKNEELRADLKRQEDEFNAKLNQLKANPQEAANIFSSNQDEFKVRRIAQLKNIVPIDSKQEADLLALNTDEFIDEYMTAMDRFTSTSTCLDGLFTEEFGHLHLPPDCVRDHTLSSRLSDGEDYELNLQAIQDNNPYAFFRYVKTLRGHSGSVYALTFVPNGQILVSGSSSSTIKLWDLRTYQETRTLTGHEDAVISLVTSQDGKTLISGSADTTIKLWNLSTGQTTHTLTGHTDSVICQAISPDGKYLASGSADTTIRLWDLNTHQAIHTLSGHSHTVLSVAISPDGETLASASADQTIKLWNLKTGSEIRTLEANSGLVFGVHFHSSEQMLVSIHDGDKTIKYWHWQTGEVIRTISTDVEIVSAAVSPDGTTLVGGGSDFSYLIGLWDLEIGKGITYFSGFAKYEHNECVYAVAFSPDGKMVASGSMDTTIKLWGTPLPLNIQ